MEEIITIVGVASLGICVSQFTPLRRFIDKLKIEWLEQLFSCSLCCSFWSGILLTQNIYYASTAAVLSSLINKII